MRTAIFGGTFDPIHSAHLEMARRAADQYQLDRVLFIPAGNPPHKQAEVSFEHRYRMVELACAEDSRFVASRLEEGAAKSYSIDTIERVMAGTQTSRTESRPFLHHRLRCVRGNSNLAALGRGHSSGAIYCGCAAGS